MLTITFTVEDLARTRLAISPLWEVVASIRLLKTPRAHRFHSRWAESTKARLGQAGVELGLLFDLVDPRVWYVADFLTPPPQSPLPDLLTDLAALRRVPGDQVRADLDVLAYARRHPIGSLEDAAIPRRLRRARPEELPSAAVVDLYDDPVAGLDRLAGELTAYWELAIAPYWGRIRALLEGDVLYRGRRFAQAGPAGLFDDLAESVRWREGALHIRHRRFKGVRQLAGEGLLLTPSAFVWPTVYSSTIPPWQPTLTYPARAIGTLWASASGSGRAGARGGGGGPVGRSGEGRGGAARGGGGVVGVLGRSRAAILGELDGPRSTTELAELVGLTAGGVSQHLGVLRAGGLVTAHRVGRVVLYARTSVAEALLAAGSESSAG